MDIEPSILAALNTITEFTSVRYIVREAQIETQPESLPFAVYTTSEKNYIEFQTMCGSDPEIFSQDFEVQIFAKTAEDSRRLANESIVALSGIGVLSGVDTEFEPDLRAFITSLQFL